MKVIKPGRSPEGWSKELKCTGKGNGGGGCGAVLLVGEGDLYRTYEFEREGNGVSHVTFRCPQCRVQTDYDNVPSSVRVRGNESAATAARNRAEDR